MAADFDPELEEVLDWLASAYPERTLSEPLRELYRAALRPMEPELRVDAVLAACREAQPGVFPSVVRIQTRYRELRAAARRDPPAPTDPLGAAAAAVVGRLPAKLVADLRAYVAVCGRGDRLESAAAAQALFDGWGEHPALADADVPGERDRWLTLSNRFAGEVGDVARFGFGP